MFFTFSKKIFTFNIFFIFTAFVFAQNTSNLVNMEVKNESSVVDSKIINFTVSLENKTDTDFAGKLLIKIPKGLKKFNNNDISINLKAKENKFLTLKLLVSNDAEFGIQKINFLLVDAYNSIVLSKTANHSILENNTLQINAENPILYRTGNEDSLRVKVRVSNLGNKKQNIALVFKIPETNSGNTFVEKQALIDIRKDSVFTFSFKPSKNLLKQSNFNVSVTGFRNSNKEIFGNTYVSIQNTSNKQTYEDFQSNNFLNPSKNAITTSYKTIGNNAEILQINGSGGFNLPSGYVYLSGNMYKMKGNNEPVFNNTYISYRKEHDEISFGSTSKLLEMPLFGRGLEYSHTNKKKTKKFEVGFTDFNFNLIEKNSFLKNGYGFYARTSFNTHDFSKNYSSTYIFKRDPYEKATHHILGTDFKYNYNENWSSENKIYSGMSLYETTKTNFPSLAIESQYTGIIKDINLNGNYYFSTNYYPGSRRGSFQIQQNASTQIFKKHYTFVNVSVSDFSPKYLFLDHNLKTNNTRIHTGINFFKKKNIGFGLGYQYQTENSNSYNNFFSNFYDQQTVKMTSHRFTETINWTSENKKNSAILNFETGYAKYPNEEKGKYQYKLNGNYFYKNLNFIGSYQLGSYFLSEYAFLKNIPTASEFKRLSLSAFYNEDFFKEKLNINLGIAYSDDIIYGKSPSSFFNLKFTNKNYSLFFNSSWYNYSYNNNIFTVEAGVSLNLQKNALKVGKKATINAFAFYDNNNNNVFDDNDQSAEGYIININNIAFKTDESGKITYKGLPFGKYKLNQVTQKGWYYDPSELNVDSYTFALNIPLHQNGTLQGTVKYDYDAKIALDFQPKFGGILFTIFQKNVQNQRLMTDDNGEFLSFLPNGKYTVILNESSLANNTYCENKSADFEVIAGKITNLTPFIIKVKTKKVNVKKFGN